MRILAVQTGLEPDSVLGGNITDREFLTRLADRGAEIHVVAEKGSSILKHNNFVPHYWKPRLDRRVPYLGNLGVALDVKKLRTELGRIDWIRFNNPYVVGLGTVLAADGQRVWGSYLHCENFKAWKLIDRWLPRRCDLITCLSEDTRKDLTERCPESDHQNNIVLPMGIDIERIEKAGRPRSEVRYELGVSDTDVVILFVGVLIPRKGIKDLIDAWRFLGNRRGVRLLMISKPVAQYESALVADLAGSDPNVIHLKKVPYERIPEYYRASDIFFFPTHHEGFGIVVGEAMASGLPVVASRAKGVRGVVAEGETALMADVGNPLDLAMNLARLLDSPELRQKLGEAGRRRIRNHFQWDRIIDSLVARLERKPAACAAGVR